MNGINEESVKSITLFYVQLLTKRINNAFSLHAQWKVRPFSLRVSWTSLTCSVDVVILRVPHCLTKQINRQTENRTVVWQYLTMTTNQIYNF